MNGGDTFFIEKRGINDHLMVVISDRNADEAIIVAVTVTTLTATKEQVCTLRPGDHPAISRDSCVSYLHARSIRRAEFERWQAADLIRVSRPVSAEVLRRIRLGAALSRFIPEAILDVLEAQDLLD